MTKLKLDWPDILKIGKTCIERYIHDHPFGLVQKDVVLAGISDLQGEYKKSRSGNISHTVLYTISGSGYFKSPGIMADLNKGDVLILPKNYCYEYGIKEHHWRICWFHLDDTELWQDFGNHSIKIKSSIWFQPVLDLSECLVLEQRNQILGSNKLIQTLSELIVTYLHRELEQIEVSFERTSKEILFDLFSNIENQLQFPWNVSLLAQKASFSRPHFYTLCKKHLKSSPMKYLNKLRMERAKHLLVFTNGSITSISIEVGYENMFHFSKAFKKAVGFSPSQYRKQITS